MTDTSRFALPLLSVGQSQKDVTHNEALARTDMLLVPVVEAWGVQTPPSSPAHGQCWILGAAPTGDWAGHAHEFACATAGGWRFATMPEGAEVWNKGAGLAVRRNGEGWVEGVSVASELRIGGNRVVGARGGAIAEPASGSTIDVESRVAISAILSRLRDHGLISS